MFKKTLPNAYPDFPWSIYGAIADIQDAFYAEIGAGGDINRRAINFTVERRLGVIIDQKTGQMFIVAFLKEYKASKSIFEAPDLVRVPRTTNP